MKGFTHPVCLALAAALQPKITTKGRPGYVFPVASPQSNFKLLAKTALLQRGMSVVDLASAIGKARNSVSIAINHPTMLPGVKRLIRRHLNLKGAA